MSTSWLSPLWTITIKLLTTPARWGHTVLRALALCGPLLSGKAIKQFFSTSSKTLSPRFNLMSGYRSWVWLQFPLWHFLSLFSFSALLFVGFPRSSLSSNNSLECLTYLWMKSPWRKTFTSFVFCCVPSSCVTLCKSLAEDNTLCICWCTYTKRPKWEVADVFVQQEHCWVFW